MKHHENCGIRLIQGHYGMSCHIHCEIKLLKERIIALKGQLAIAESQLRDANEDDSWIGQ